ncbi:MAG: chromosome partitioning protein ParA [Clostridia bacterium]|nr:chromosome partitioning protein ParA [Clostridia bacterium]
MKIKLAILEKDQNYLNRIVTVFSTKYIDKFQIYSFTSMEMAFESVASEKIDVLIANDLFEIDVDKLPARCSFAYFVDSPDVDTVNNQRAICKFQKAELIYKEILSLYSENAGSLAGLKLTDDECKIITFSSPCGGTGTSSLAAACAINLASKGKRTLYLPLENFGSSDVFFSAEGQFDMSDVIFALKSKKANLAMKLESYVKQDYRGVYFFAAAKFALDMLELKHDEKMQLISNLKMTGSYDYIILDIDFALDKEHFDYYTKSHNVIMVCDGSEISDLKVMRAFAALETMDQNSETPILNRFCLAYNKFSNKSGHAVSDNALKNIGGAPVYAQATVQQIIGQLATSDMFNNLD